MLGKDTGRSAADDRDAKTMYKTKNRYFDNHPIIGDLSFCLTGDSILFAQTIEDWRKSCKAISPAFYKCNPERLVDMAKVAVVKTVDRFH